MAWWVPGAGIFPWIVIQAVHMTERGQSKELVWAETVLGVKDSNLADYWVKLVDYWVKLVD
jgi:hypothetical protein